MQNKSYKISILGCGWLGLPLARRLLADGYEVHGSTRTPSKLAVLHQAGIKPYLIEVQKQIKGSNIQHFFQSDILILNIPPGRKRRDVARSHPLQIKAIIEKVLKFGVSKVLFVSSTSVYGNQSRTVTEADDPTPATESGKALVTAENLLTAQSAFQTTIVRFGGLVGTDRPAGRFLAGKKDVAGGNAPVNMIHLEDCIGIIRAIIHQNCWGELFNGCASGHPDKKTFYSEQANKQGFESPTFHKDDFSSGKTVSNFKVKKELCYEFIKDNPLEF